MLPKLYRELVPWYRLVDPTEDHFDEVSSYRRAFEQGVTSPLATLLELGAGAGNNAFHLKAGLRCTLTDLSEDMLQLNPECEHVQGDMRTLRLGRTFDAVLVHDAIMYMLDEEDLRAAIETAFVHTRPGGAAVFAPDYVTETFEETTELADGRDTDGKRALRYVAWLWDPDPLDTAYRVEYAFFLRQGDHVEVVHDRHVEGLFPRTTWERLFREVGFTVESFERQLDERSFDQCFLCRKPAKLA